MERTTALAHLAELLGGPAGGRRAYEQLAAGLRQLVVDGRLLVGARIPSERELAGALGVSRSTVTAAYGLLREAGYLTGTRGAGSSVALPAVPVARPDEPLGADPSLLDLTAAAPPAPAELPALVTAAVAGLPPLLSGVGLHPLGLQPLRQAIADRYTARGQPTTPAQILVTQGALHGWDLLLRAYAAPGARVAVEQPTYPAALDAVAAARARPLLIGVDPGGWALDPALAAWRRTPPVLALLTPDHQNPTGAVLPEEARDRLRRLASDRTLVVTDETFAELWLDGPPTARPLATGRGADTVVTLGSLSKVVWAGLRIGWLRAPEAVVRRVAVARTSQDAATPALEQLVALQVLGQLDALLPGRRAAARERRDALLAALAEQLPAWRPTRPSGGLALWVDLGAGTSSTALTRAARTHGVRLTPGPRFTVGGTHDRFLRLPYTLPVRELREAVRRLRAASADLPGPAVGVAVAAPTWTT